ncbi:divalent cation transporter [Roseospira marina]|uniref:Divalent cation transporter n=1 Tax=Roseospira marina TaxID=140057 RepID=A0A5M6I503_9PROT|nr:divalent cation transporter [Roseospira marina]KAA5603262.1 divalent cation transporter [Roseospira marina]MBB4316163.1 ZIP family zinc transporter [Roseospira marina]MBB5089361.1 ZIP family zinc transporter [Roseospira marina]
MRDSTLTAVLLAALAGLPILLGGALARVEGLLPGWLDREVRHTVTALVGGILIAAVALVLIPKGTEALSPLPVALCMGGGGVLFLWVDKALSESGAKVSQLLAMLLDYVPEAIALGAMLATGDPAAYLLALLIGLQNLPEGFNALREMTVGRHGLRFGPAFGLLAGCTVLGPLAALGGTLGLGDHPALLGGVMLMAAGGILYLTFQDIAPQAHLRRGWGPPLGAVAGVLIGVLGEMVMR